jgi:hypothetical protein
MTLATDLFACSGVCATNAQAAREQDLRELSNSLHYPIPWTINPPSTQVISPVTKLALSEAK